MKKKFIAVPVLWKTESKENKVLEDLGLSTNDEHEEFSRAPLYINIEYLVTYNECNNSQQTTIRLMDGCTFRVDMPIDKFCNLLNASLDL